RPWPNATLRTKVRTPNRSARVRPAFDVWIPPPYPTCTTIPFPQARSLTSLHRGEGPRSSSTGSALTRTAAASRQPTIRISKDRWLFIQVLLASLDRRAKPGLGLLISRGRNNTPPCKARVLPVPRMSREQQGHCRRSYSRAG